ncbi:Aquaporin NIP1-1 [Apostasia shenzhenica]|uniref:Aquaporin NIP1-1 n=1 Tax=Apostasia shenzhenica TaxID=1088818 RepID=A0A2I0B9K8_9ASPA|nr:Aquaporin NIP1-1 [Apostasia shenzhenica]
MVQEEERGKRERERERERQRERERMAEVRSMEEGTLGNATEDQKNCISKLGLNISIPFLQKIFAEVLGTYFLIFAGCGAVTVDKKTKGVITFPGVCAVWGLAITVMIYAVGHISGAHFNPAVTIAFAACRRFSLKQVPAYVGAQMVGATLASGTLRLLLGGGRELFAGTTPAGSEVQALVMEFIVSFYLMFVISGVATDNRAIGELAGIAVGATILLNVAISGPVSGASMNPARTLGPAIIANRYQSIWVYIVGPSSGTIAGAWTYNLIRYTDKPLRELTKSGSFLKSLKMRGSG